MKEEKYMVFHLRDDGVPLQWAGAKAWRYPEFVPYVGEDGRPEWKCEALSMTLHARGAEWGVFEDASGDLVMRPFEMPKDRALRPPEGLWVAVRKNPRTGDLPLLYDVKGRSVMVG